MELEEVETSVMGSDRNSPHLEEADTIYPLVDLFMAVCSIDWNDPSVPKDV